MVITYVNEYTKLDMKQPVQEKKIWEILETVTDPEIPVLSIIDMGIVRAVQLNNDGELTITITPTYSGCPAMDAISMDIRLKLIEQGYRHVKILSVLSPAWTTDWMSEAGKEKLKAYGIAPPVNRAEDAAMPDIECPQCHSHHTSLLSQFGSTACKALYQCNECKEPFDYFKCH